MTPSGNKPRFPEPAYTKNSAATIITPFTDNLTLIPLKQYHAVERVGVDTKNIENPFTGQICTEITPYYFCHECNSAFHGAPDTAAAMRWTLPDSVGPELLNNGWSRDPQTGELVFKSTQKETERRADGNGVYSSQSSWNWTLPLYLEGKNFTSFISGVTVTDPSKISQLNFTPAMMTWIKSGQEFEVIKDE